jgi:FHA domain-containing protein
LFKRRPATAVPELVVVILKYFFLLLIFLFLARAVRAMLQDIAGPAGTSGRAGAPRSGTDQMKSRQGRPPDRVVVQPAEGRSTTYELEDELIVGRGEKCDIVLSDTYCSQVHARIFRKDGSVFIEDMGSTNGTFLNRRKVTSPLPVQRGDRARVGKTGMEFKR